MAVDVIALHRGTPHLFRPSAQDCLPKHHLARFVVKIVGELDFSALVSAYAGSGSKPYHSAMLVALLFYGYATGVFSSRKHARVWYSYWSGCHTDSLAKWS